MNETSKFRKGQPIWFRAIDVSHVQNTATASAGCTNLGPRSTQMWNRGPGS